jgi:CheY-like chemotaxis protein
VAAARPAGRPERPLKILVAEDNPVNRQVVTALLEKRGHAVQAVEDGRGAVDADAAALYDVIIMDVQMPRMSGLEAAASIRARERTSGRHVPIVALTAHAMQGDRERCLSAGMDGYLTKPIDVDELISTIERFGTQSARAQESAAASPTSRRSRGRATFDEQAALKHTGDRGLLKRVVTMFLSDAWRSVDRIDRAIESGDAEALRTYAHALKGSAATVGGLAVSDLAAALEQIGRSGVTTGARTLAVNLRRQVTELAKAFAAANLIRATRASSRAARRAPASKATRTRRRR